MDGCGTKPGLSGESAVNPPGMAVLPHPTSDPKTPRGAGRRSQRRHPAGSRAWPHVTPTTCSALQDGQGKALGISDRNLLPSQFRNSKTRRPWAARGRLRREEREGQGHFRAPSSFHEVQIQSFIDLTVTPGIPTVLGYILPCSNPTALYVLLIPNAPCRGEGWCVKHLHNIQEEKPMALQIRSLMWCPTQDTTSGYELCAGDYCSCHLTSQQQLEQNY